VLVACRIVSDLILQLESSSRRCGLDPDSYSQSADTPGDSKTDTRDDSEIRNGSCSTDQTAIRAQNRIISCECLLLCYYLFTIDNSCCMITHIISCEHLTYFISIVVRIISCGIGECSLYLYSLFEHLSASFHV